MGFKCQIPVATPYNSDTPNYASLNWQMLSQYGYYGNIGYGGGYTLLYSTAIVAGQQAVDALNPKTYASKDAYIFQLANDAETKEYFGVELDTRYLNRNFIIAANYPFQYCQTMNYEKDGITSYIGDMDLIEYNGKRYFMRALSWMWITGNPRYADNGAFSNLYNAYYSLAEFFRENPWIRPVETAEQIAHGEYLTASCLTAYGHKIGSYGEPNYFAYSPLRFASGTPATIKITPSEGYSIATPGHLKAFKDGVEIPYTRDLENGLINFTTP